MLLLESILGGRPREAGGEGHWADIARRDRFLMYDHAQIRNHKGVGNYVTQH